MIIVRETTVWPDKTKNHIYVLSDDKRKMYGYVKQGTLEAQKFSKPMSFDARGRTFKVLKKGVGKYRPAETAKQDI